jgi:hypothetical protein
VVDRERAGDARRLGVLPDGCRYGDPGPDVFGARFGVLGDGLRLRAEAVKPAAVGGREAVNSSLEATFRGSEADMFLPWLTGGGCSCVEAARWWSAAGFGASCWETGRERGLRF